PAVPGDRAARTGGARRQHAVEHIDTGLDHLEDPLGVADSHEVAGLLRRKERRYPVGRLEHRAPVLADREPADRLPVDVELAQLLDAARPDVAVDAALVDRDPELSFGAAGVALASGPLGRAPHGILKFGVRDAGRGHLVEAHRDVAAEVALDRSGEFRREP